MKAFPGRSCDDPGVSGISSRFQRLSRRRGQVGHVLLTRSPLYIRRSGLIVRLACVRHAASVHPEPGSNSPFDLGLPVSREREPTGFHKFENKSEFKEVSNKCTLWHVSICLPRRMSCMPSVRHSIRFSRCRRARARRSRLVAAQERTIPASRMPCQGKFSRNFSDPSAEGWYGGDDHKHNHHSLLSVPPSVFFARRQTAMQRQETLLEKKPY